MLRLVSSYSKFSNSFMPVHRSFWSKPAYHDRYSIISSESFVQCPYRLHHFHHIVFGFHKLSRVAAVIAAAAILISILFTEITHQYLAPAHTAFGKSYCFIYQLRTHFAFAQGLVAHEVLEFRNVFVRIIQDTLSFQSISACTTGFLVVVL